MAIETNSDVRIPSVTAGMKAVDETPSETLIDLKNLNVFYGSFHAVNDVNLTIPKNRITAFIGPSGCGKSTVLRCINRMNDLVPSARVEGQIMYRGTDLNGSSVDPVEVRRRVGLAVA